MPGPRPNETSSPAHSRSWHARTDARGPAISVSGPYDDRVSLPRTSPASVDVSSPAIDGLLDSLGLMGIECHSLMIVRRGHVIAEGWWAPYAADDPHLLYSLTKSFTAMGVGLVVDDGLMSLDDRVVDILPDHVPDDIPAEARLLTVEHLLTMTAGHAEDTLDGAWTLEPSDLVRGFLRMPLTAVPGTRHTYDNATTFVLARMIERVSGQTLPHLLDERLFAPMGITDVEWDRVGSGAVFGFHGLHLTTEAVAAFGELMLRGGEWQGRQLLSSTWMASATRKHIDSWHYSPGASGADFHSGYGYQIWLSAHGFHGNGAYGQQCVVVPDLELVVVLTAAHTEIRHAQDALDAIWEHLLPGIDAVGDPDGDAELTCRLRHLALPMIHGNRGSTSTDSQAVVDATHPDSAVPRDTPVLLRPQSGGWLLRIGPRLAVPVGFGHWERSAPLGRTLASAGAWQGDVFVAEIHLVNTPHRVRLTLRGATAALTWVTVPLTGSDLITHATSPLMTRPDVA
ncbi:serine hydrolase domain-containing protein [Microbacterium sp. WCS2018Hpa-23]|uniref:serine hydrolase domain-containing protein n=1 Tax=Microbacterium sp. WCS2018Hpa-23 TaxID=3073634 RepID=UPI002883369E|nr:serine hydrolase domain-containing protein [Microbacterium sp. WCS2018Hpa-23]